MVTEGGAAIFSFSFSSLEEEWWWEGVVGGCWVLDGMYVGVCVSKNG